MPEQSRPRSPRSDFKGNRTVVSLKVPDDLKGRLEDICDREVGEDMPLGSWLIELICEARGLEVPDYVLSDRQKAERARFQDSQRKERPLRVA